MKERAFPHFLCLVSFYDFSLWNRSLLVFQHRKIPKTEIIGESSGTKGLSACSINGTAGTPRCFGLNREFTFLGDGKNQSVLPLRAAEQLVHGAWNKPTCVLEALCGCAELGPAAEQGSRWGFHFPNREGCDPSGRGSLLMDGSGLSPPS